MQEDGDVKYESISDLPTVIDLRAQLLGMKFFALLPGKIGRELRRTVSDTEKELNALVTLLDNFYKLLGNKNWIFNEGLPTEDIKAIIDTDDPEIAERRLIDWYLAEDNIGNLLRLIQRHEGIKVRMPLLQKALKDYKAGRYYSTVFILIAQVDGFVNDYDPSNRRALSTRDDVEMRAYNSATAVADALPRVSRIYQKAVFKFSDSEVHELYRNGIMHGELSNFDNDVVASKAWNLLFAAIDWAEAKKKREEQLAAPIKETPTFKELIKDSMNIQDDMKRLDEWKPYETSVAKESPDPSGVRKDCLEYCEAWRNRNYMIVARHVANPLGEKEGKLISDVRKEYFPHPITNFQLLKIENYAASAAYVHIRITPDGGKSYDTKTRWTRIKESTDWDPAYPWQEGHWVITQWAFAPFTSTDDTGE